MPTIKETRALLIEKLQELFQLDQPDLDFGFYRIMHLRSKEISDFLKNDLLSQVQEALTEYTPVEKQQVQKQLTEAIKQAETLGIDPESVPKVKELREKLTESTDLQQVECDVYDALYHFFSRYYSDGDFISQRVYKEGVYAIPYGGEEVKLHWANADQYYVKTCEYLRDYCFRTPSNRRVHFKLIDAAEGEHGNIKAAEGKNRVFILAKDNFCSEGNGELTLRFEYRPATMNDWPKDERGDQSSPPSQEALLTFADTQILALSDIETWTAELSVPYTKSNGEEAGYSTLFHHLKRYSARNTFDYFIHKDLGTFLRRELDFFIKNEIMYLDDIEKETAPRVEQYLSKLRAVRRIAKKIIEFLAQLENFQKKLWLKKKFVVETNYCITLDRVPEEFYEEIAANDAQREEWKRLFDYLGNAGFQPASSGQASCLSVPLPSLFDNISQAENDLPLWHSRGYLPHFDASICQFITFRLFDSVPSDVVLDWKKELKWDENLSANSKEAVALRQKIEKYEDQGKGSCFLADSRIATLIKEALFHFDGTRYNLLNWCIMPNHVHVLIEILENNSLADIIHSWKSYTANKANKILSRSGLFWMQENYDRYIRNHEHYQATFDYIDNNPVKAGLVNSPNEWSWSAIGSNLGTAGFQPAQPGNAGFQPAQKNDIHIDTKMQAGSLRSQEEDAGRMPALPGHCVKYLRLESYEDTLNNLAFKTNSLFYKELKDPDLREEYMLKYFLELESQGSPSLLNTETFFDPTEYQLKIKKPGSDESVDQKVDLLETFNYLIGLKVKNIGKPERFSAKFKRDQDGKLILDGKLKRDKSGLWWFRTVTGETLDGQKVLVIWRNRPGKDVVKEDSFEMSPKTRPKAEWNRIISFWTPGLKCSASIPSPTNTILFTSMEPIISKISIRPTPNGKCV